ncbi:MAG: hypothetical protein FWH57_11155 [Oscillospiraceae bacterium]|nr:hypothetical protein [Oscillospiraceae bacterium]
MSITIRQFEMAVRATIEKKLRRSLKVLGPTGIGKSEVVHQIAKSYGMGVIDIRLLLWSLTDLKGVPYPDDTHTYTKWLINDVLPRSDRDGDNGILLLEELDDAPKTVRAAAYQLTLDRKLGNYMLGDGWYIIATSNREQDGGAYTASLAPLNDRFEIHEVEPDFQTWRDYAIKVGFNPLIIAYLSANQTALYTFKPEETADVVFATPRSWAAVSDLLDSGLEGEVLRTKTVANVGLSEATGFFKYLKNTKLLPNIEAVLSGAYIGGNTDTPYHAPLDAYWLLIQNLVHAIGAEFRRDGDNWRLFADNSVNFICHINSFPLELKKSYVDQLCEIDVRMREYLFNSSRNKKLSELLQQLDYLKA